MRRAADTSVVGPAVAFRGATAPRTSRRLTGGFDIYTRLGLLLLVSLIPAGCGRTAETAEALAGGPTVRVRLLTAATSVEVDGDGLTCVVPGRTDADGRVDRPLGDGTHRFTLNDDRWSYLTAEVGRLTALPFAGPLTIRPGDDAPLRLNGRTYAGQIVLVPVRPGRFDVINQVDIDAYLVGVVSRELYAHWHPEAFRAQAVAARTYALHQAAMTPASRHWDLHGDTRSQAYASVELHQRRALDAVETTRGVVLASGEPGREKVFKAYYAACCGGTGLSAADVFRDPDIQPLQARHVGDLCAISPQFRWGPLRIEADELARRLRSAREEMRGVRTVRDVRVADRNRLGRPTRFEIVDQNGTPFSLLADQFRTGVNADSRGGPTLLSGFVTPRMEGDQVLFEDGRGFGHGVGMCQWCMQAAALKGVDAETILRGSYPGATLVRAY